MHNRIQSKMLKQYGVLKENQFIKGYGGSMCF